MGAVTSRPSLVIKNQAGIFKVACLTSLLYVNPVVGLFNYGTDRKFGLPKFHTKLEIENCIQFSEKYFRRDKVNVEGTLMNCFILS